MFPGIRGIFYPQGMRFHRNG